MQLVPTNVQSFKSHEQLLRALICTGKIAFMLVDHLSRLLLEYVFDSIDISVTIPVMHAGGLCCLRRRGEWWTRLSLDLEHMGRPDESLEVSP